MTFDKLQQTYQEQLVKAGVSPQKAEQAAKGLSLRELQLIGEIWQDWGDVFSNINLRLLP